MKCECNLICEENGAYRIGDKLCVCCKSLHHYDIINALSSSNLFTSFDIYDDVTENFGIPSQSTKVYRVTSRLDKSTTFIRVSQS